LLGLLVASSILAAFGAHVRLERLSGDGPAGEQLLYLPSGKLLKVWSLGHQETLADLIYLWSIQFYGHYRGGQRYDRLMQIYDTVVTELDPRFRDAYLLGSLILALEARRPEDALSLLEKGIEANPDDWMLPFEAGFVAFESLNDYRRAADYFQISMERPGAHPAVRRFRAAMFDRLGDEATSLSLWMEILETADSDYVESVAAKHVHDLTIDYHLEVLEGAVDQFHAQSGSYPPHLRALVSAGLLNQIPVDPEGRPYRYDSDTGEVSAVSARALMGRKREAP
jgi:tetratricopeptide (TPR) repeat protein